MRRRITGALMPPTQPRCRRDGRPDDLRPPVPL